MYCLFVKQVAPRKVWVHFTDFFVRLIFNTIDNEMEESMVLTSTECLRTLNQTKQFHLFPLMFNYVIIVIIVACNYYMVNKISYYTFGRSNNIISK